jgi:hypothetical protein
MSKSNIKQCDSEPLSQSWADEVKQEDEEISVLPPDSIANFDRKEVDEYETKVASELKIDQLLKLLIRRGEQQLNPALAKGSEKLLRQLNCEYIHPPRPKRVFERPSKYPQKKH